MQKLQILKLSELADLLNKETVSYYSLMENKINNKELLKNKMNIREIQKEIDARKKKVAK